MREPARAALDDVSDHLGEVLRRADRLLVEWTAFGASVRAQVDREAQTIAATVASSLDGAVRGVADRAIATQVEARLAALSTELGRLETRTRAIAAERATSRRLAFAAVAGILLANVLLVLLLLRPATVPPPMVPAPREEAAVASPADAGVDAPADAPTDAPNAGVDAAVPADAAPVKPPTTKPAPRRTGSALPARRS